MCVMEFQIRIYLSTTFINTRIFLKLRVIKKSGILYVVIVHWLTMVTYHQVTLMHVNLRIPKIKNLIKIGKHE